ncbi:hypothetical protein [Chryseobacterium sp. Mn2064]|uniref:hypothetical protein n=1 Tax=Chryseobacterium sp. Mn2064 TaxID=3395263 RepID=UPI003BDDAB28
MLTEVIDKSYNVFAKYNPTRPLDICTDCCMTAEDEQRLAEFQVRMIPKDLLAEYNDGAKTDKPRIEEVKHFLPRYLDLVGQFEFPSHSAELSFSRLIHLDKLQWTTEEFELLDQFSTEYFKHCLSIYPLPSSDLHIDTIIIMLWKAGFNIEKLLENWKNIKTRESILHFRDLYFYSFKNHNFSRLINVFGDHVLAGILGSWLEMFEIRQNFALILEKVIILENDLDDKDANDLNVLYECIKN